MKLIINGVKNDCQNNGHFFLFKNEFCLAWQPETNPDNLYGISTKNFDEKWIFHGILKNRSMVLWLISF